MSFYRIHMPHSMSQAESSSETTPLINATTALRDSLSPASSRKSSATSVHKNNAEGTHGGSTFWRAVKHMFDVENRILLTGFLITLSFSFTQVPLFYVFHLMVCDVYYQTHPPYIGNGERCSVNEIAAGTARQFSILGMSTCICGTMNLFFTGWLIKRIGPKTTLTFQTLVPAMRVLLQIAGVIAGGNLGMTIIQATQIVTVFGGPAGYVLVVNVIVGELINATRRTGTFGKLQGCVMLGMAVGYITGGKIGDNFGIQMPFKVAFVSFMLASLYASLALPFIDPQSMSGTRPGASHGGGFLAPLRILKPQITRLASGRITKHYGVIFLCAGIFTGVVATGYAPLLIQMYATAAFDFTLADNGLMMSEFSFVRSLFLVFIFPRIITWGRIKYSPRQEHLKKSKTTARDTERSSLSDSVTPLNGSQTPTGYSAISTAQTPTTKPSSIDLIMPTHPEEIEIVPANAVEPEIPPISDSPNEEIPDLSFDLVFLRWSLVVDGALTTLAAFATQKWHIYLAALLIPLSSGSAPAAKGVITDMCTPSQRADALNAVTLVENMANLTTQGLFGYVFAALATAGVSHMTFFCNAAIALVAMGVLMFSRFPQLGSSLLDGEEAEEADRLLAEGI